jgi:glycogen debranching enzyme
LSSIVYGPILQDKPQETPFYIPADGQAARPRRTLKHDDTFAVLDTHGDIGASVGSADGIFHRDTRYLSRLELLVDGEVPLLLGSSIHDDNGAFTVDLTNPDLYRQDELVLPKDTLHIRRTVFLWQNSAYVRLGIRNHGTAPASTGLTIAFASDFADIFEVRGMERPRRGRSKTPIKGGSQHILLAYEGLDGEERISSLYFDPPPTKLEGDHANFTLELRPQEACALFVVIGCNQTHIHRPFPFLRAMARATREMRAMKKRRISVGTSSDVFNQILARSLADLDMLSTETPAGPYPYAGIPWYSTTFGRDGLITALEMLWCAPHMAKAVLERLASIQANSFDPVRDAEPGKIAHELRNGEMANLREVPFGRYYGSVDSTPLFLVLAGAYAQRTADWDLIRAIWPNIEAALGWIDGPGDVDRDGFVDYARATDTGLVNQGWKDSHDSIFHADGELAEGPIALAEVQAYVYEAKRGIARCARALAMPELAVKLDREADELKRRFEEAFWCDEIGTYALALDGDKKPCRVRTSNAGHVLLCGLASPERATRVANDLLGRDFMSGWGIRTVAQGEARYNPMAYHNGSIWPHDNALIAMGLARYGMNNAAAEVFQTISSAASYMEFYRLPELYCGFRRAPRQAPTLYPVACAPQAWASAAPFALIQATLGLQFDPLAQRITLAGPVLPQFLDMIVLSNVPLGDARADFGVYRDGGSLSLEIFKNEAGLDISIA